MILLINPWIYDFSAYDLWVKPLGLLNIAEELFNKGYDVSLIDCLESTYKDPKKEMKSGCGRFPYTEVPRPRVLKDIRRRYKRYGIDVDEFHRRLKRLSSRPSAVLITSLMTYWYEGVRFVSEILKKEFSGVPIILGGIYASLCTDHARNLPAIDLVLPGHCPDISSVLQGRFKIYPENTGKEILAVSLYRDTEYAPLLTSYGCPFRCTYCASSLLYKGFRVAKPGDVLKRIECCHRYYNIKDFVFYDDALLYNFKGHLRPILQNVLQNNISVSFHAPNGLNVRYMKDPGVTRLLKQAGFKTIRLSLETADKSRQDKTGGKVNNEDFISAVGNLEKSGFELADVYTYVMFGFKDQPLEEVYRTAEYVRNLGPKVTLTEFSPIPGTPDGDQAIMELMHWFPSDHDDPILQNNSLFFWLSGRNNWKDVHELKMKVKRLNDK